MKFSLISALTSFSIAAIVMFAWLSHQPKVPRFAPIPPEQRQPFAIDLSLPSLRGETFRLADLRGQVVLLNVWATWCYPCRAEMPAMAALYRRYQSGRHPTGFTVIAVANDAQGRKVVEPFVTTHKLPFPVLLDAQNALGVQLKLPGIPTSYLLDLQGRIVLREVGQRDWNYPDVHRLVDALLAESTGL